MSVKTISLTGTETAVSGLDGANAAIRNDSTDIIYASKQPGITPVADGVLSIPAGGSAVVYSICGAVYLLGTGSATIVSSDYNENPFKTSAQGGSGADEVARAAITTHADDADIHVTADDKTNWNGKTTLNEAAQVFSNPNLLINPDFKINRRGNTEYISTVAFVYAIDRWKFCAGTVTVNDGYVNYTSDSTQQTYPRFLQFTEHSLVAQQTYTLSAKVKLNNYSGYTVFRVCNDKYSNVTPNTATARVFTAEDVGKEQIISFAFTPDANYSNIGVEFLCPQIGTSSMDIDIYWVKLELGSVATPFVPPDPATELAKCQRYYQIHSTGDIAAVDMRPSMREITDIKQREDGNYEYIAEL